MDEVLVILSYTLCDEPLLFQSYTLEALNVHVHVKD